MSVSRLEAPKRNSSGSSHGRPSSSFINTSQSREAFAVEMPPAVAEHFRGRFIGSERALAVGLVSELVDDGGLDAAAESYVDAMMTASPVGLRLSKECLNMAVDAGSIESVIAMEDRNQVLCSRSEDFNEGIRAFLEKRKPVYIRR